MIVLKVFLLYLLADFITGYFHFLLDQYGNPQSKYFKNAIKINLAHHENPRKITTRGYWELTKDSYWIGGVIFGISLFFGFYWEIVFVLIVGAQANILHLLAHRKKSENPKWIVLIQKVGIFQSSRLHSKHHKNPFDSYFCVMTDFLNPFLEFIDFWANNVKLLKWFGIHTVAGTQIRNNV